MKLYWSNGSHNGTSVNHAFMASIVENYFVHPFKAQSLGSTEIDELNDIIRSYAEQATQADNANRSVLRRAATYGGHDHHHDELTDNLQSAFNWMVELNTLVGPIFARNRMPTIVELNRIWHWLTNADDQSGHLSRGGTGVGSQLSNIARSFIYGL